MKSKKSLLMTCLLTLASVTANAADVWWIQNDGDLSEPTKWEGGEVPGVEDNAYVRGGNTTITEGDNFEWQEFTIGRGWGRYTTKTRAAWLPSPATRCLI